MSFETLNAFARERGVPERDLVCKPQTRAFEMALEMAGGEPRTSVFMDDSARNVAGAKAAGLMGAVLVGRAEPCEGADAAIASVRELPPVLETILSASQQGRLLQQQAAAAVVPAA